MPETVYLIDVYSLLFQVFHAIPAMTSPSGQPTNAVFGFTRDVLNILRDKRPEYLICAMDTGGPAVRNEIYTEYKANRSEMPVDLLPQIPLLREILEAFRIPMLEHAGWEADDVIATLTRMACERGLDVRIVTNDKDARQLINACVKLYNVRKNTLLDEEFLKEDWGIRPDQVIDFQSLVGDSVDNVPGIPLVGPKKASALLNQYGTLDEVLAHADDAPGTKLRENLKQYAEQARTSRQLVALNTDLPLEVDWDALRTHRPDVPRLQEIFRRLGFRRFVDEVRQIAPPAPQQQGSLFTAPEDQASDRNWQVVATPEAFEQFIRDLAKQKRFAVDLETTSLDAVQAKICGWAFSWEPGSGYYLPIRCPEGEACLDEETVVRRLKPILERPDIEIINQNVKYDLIVMKTVGIEPTALGLDPMVGDYLLDAGARSHNLDRLAEKYLNHKMIPISDLIGKGKEQKLMSAVPVAQVAEYAVEDAEIALRLADRITDELKREGLWDLYWNLERPLIPVLAEMEFLGIRVDVEELKRQSEAITRQLELTVQQIYDLAGREFNIDSPLQLRVVLFDEQKLPVLKRTKTGPSTDQDVLEELALVHPLPAKIMEQRRLSKLKGTYLDALPMMVNPETGRIHASFNQVVASTGRLSSSDPNLQNIPIRTPEGSRVRRAFIPERNDWRLVCADYSQIELRMLAHFSHDPELIEAFRKGIDIHTAVASEVFSVPLDQVTPDMRRIAKTVNFGVLYGQSPFGLSVVLRISKEDAATFIENYFAKYPGVERFMDQVLEDCVERGYVSTILGRRRAIEGLRTERTRNRNTPERTAINAVVQGSAADLIKQAMVNLHARLRREKHPARMLLQIHDELVFEVPEAEVASLASIAREEMTSAMPLAVPLVVDVKAGTNWLDAAPL